jgi:hypothetical protein
MEFSTTRSIRLTRKYLRTVYDLTATVNDAPFLGFPTGDVLFLGMEAQFRDPQKGWQGTYKFAMSPTRMGADILGPTDPEDTEALIPFSGSVKKAGWDYLWFGFTASKATGGRTQKPIVATINKTAPRRNFALLGIGV